MAINLVPWLYNEAVSTTLGKPRLSIKFL